MFKFKIYGVTHWETNYNTQIATIISRSKGNKTMKFGQLIEYQTKFFFLEISYIKCGGEASPRPFHKKSKLSIFLDQLYEHLYSLTLLHFQVDIFQNVLKLKY